MSDEISKAGGPALLETTIAVVHDNNPYSEGFSIAWGFSAFLATGQKNILFDTGPDPASLLGNMQRLGLDPHIVDLVFLSHIHPDHSGGLEGLLRNHPRVTVCVPKSLPDKFKQNILQYGTKLIEAEKPIEICANVYSSGQLGGLLKEQALIMRTARGLVVIIGCAHPGLAAIVTVVQKLFNERIFLLMGGFHLEWASSRKVEKIASLLEKLQLQYIGACHCSGEKARSLFQRRFGSNYIVIGAGKIITLSELP